MLAFVVKKNKEYVLLTCDKRTDKAKNDIESFAQKYVNQLLISRLYSERKN